MYVYWNSSWVSRELDNRQVTGTLSMLSIVDIKKDWKLEHSKITVLSIFMDTQQWHIKIDKIDRWNKMKLSQTLTLNCK